jgi:hypothetical protein
MRRINNEDAKTQRHEDETEETMITATFTLTAEVAMKLRVTQQVLDLIEEGKLQARPPPAIRLLRPQLR